MRRSLRSGLVAVGVLLAACGDDDDLEARADHEPVETTATTTATTLPALDEEPPPPGSILVVAGHDVVRLAPDGTTTTLATVDGAPGLAAGDGSGAVVAEVEGDLVLVADGDAQPLAVGRPGENTLYDVAVVDGTSHVLHAWYDRNEGEGPLLLTSLPDLAEREIGHAYAPEYGVGTATIAGDLLVTTATSDLTEDVTIRPIDGQADPDAWTPTTDLAYNEPPFVLNAVLAPDGSTIAWLEAPDSSGAAQVPEQTVGSWAVVVADRKGVESARIALDAEPRPQHLDFDGTRLLVSRADAPALVIDLATGERHELPVAGVATFEQ